MKTVVTCFDPDFSLKTIAANICLRYDLTSFKRTEIKIYNELYTCWTMVSFPEKENSQRCKGPKKLYDFYVLCICNYYWVNCNNYGAGM